MGTERSVGGAAEGVQETVAEAGLEQPIGLDAPGLVNQLVAAGEWPEPGLVGQILEAGDAVVEPLQQIIRTRPLGWPQEAPVVHAAGILSMLRPPSVLPDLVELARFYKNETGRVAADSIAAYGTEGFETLLELISDPSVIGYHRTHFIENANCAAGDDPAKRARLAEVLRPLFMRVVGEVKEDLAVRQELRKSQQGIDGDGTSPSGEVVEETGTQRAVQPGDADEDEAIRRMNADNEIHPTEALAFLVCDLCDLADPLARGMIQSAFDEHLVDEAIVGQDTAWRIYDKGGESYQPNRPWFQDYSESYFENRDYRERMARTPQVEFPSRTSYPDFSPGSMVAPPAPAEPYRHAAPKIGRNDPCWCGSGRKYKKCHLGQDAPG